MTFNFDALFKTSALIIVSDLIAIPSIGMHVKNLLMILILKIESISFQRLLPRFIV